MYICTDILGHVLICDTYSCTVLLLNQDGQFLCQLLGNQQGIEEPASMYVDDENNLHVGQIKTNTVKVYKYLR